jgi:hypothetical protein
MEHLSSDMEQQHNQEQQHGQQIQWRRDKVQELCSKDTAKERYNKYYKLG